MHTHTHTHTQKHAHTHTSQIDSESGKKVAANLKTIEADLQQMKTENSQLLARLKA